MSDKYPSLGTGKVYTGSDRVVIHFGSPQGTQFGSRPEDSEDADSD